LIDGYLLFFSCDTASLIDGLLFSHFTAQLS